MIKNLTYLVLVLASVLAIGSMARTAGTVDGGVIGFMLWAISPYVLVGILVFVLGRLNSMRLVPTAGLIAALAMLGVSAYVYLVAMDHSSSTEALAYVFLPIYFHVGGVLTLAVGAIASMFAPKAA
jgi:hypothetical protein